MKDGKTSQNLMNGHFPANKVLSVIIVSYQSKDLLSACLKSIEKEMSSDYEVIVSDNGSDDGTIEMVQKEFTFVNLICNRANLGFAKANNIALDQAGGKYILLLNPDTELTGSTLARLIGFMEENPSVSAAGCKVLYPDGTFQYSCGYLPTPATAVLGGVTINRLYRRIFPESDFLGASGLGPQALESDTHEVETLLGACVIVRRSVLEKIGLFDENMFMYFEECDLFLRIRNNGGKIMYMTDTSIIHHAGGTTQSTGKSVSFYQESLEYYLVKNFSLNGVNVFRLMILVSALIKCITLSLFFVAGLRRSRERLKSKIAWHWHTFRFILGRLGAPATTASSQE